MRIFILLFICVLTLIFNNTKAQVFSSANFIKGGKSDAIKIVSAYLFPVEKSLSFDGINSKLLLYKKSDELHFGMGINLSSSFINNQDNTYDIKDLSLSEFEPSNPQYTIAQTLSGNENTIGLQTKDTYKIPSSSFPFYEEVPILSFNSPKGNNLQMVSIPTINFFAEKQGNMIGINFLPPLKFSDSSIGLFEIGIDFQYNLKSSFDFLSNLWADIYFSTGYTFTNLNYYLDINPNQDALKLSVQSDNGPYDNQKLQINANSIPVKIMMVKEHNKFSFFAGCGYNIMTSLVRMIGTYPVYSTDPTDQFQIIAKDIEDPFEYTRSFSKLSLDLGANYRSKHLLLGLEYAHSYYKNVSLSVSYIL